ncbi:MAG: hypothetical protein P1V36_02480 [Planctomycetota bacterium]|nr:hypothetical protein [Planctomycetota bacterium]
MLHVGVDEAGYGPLLGPLVIGAAAFRIDETTRPHGIPDPCGWRTHLRRRLKGLVVRARGTNAARGLPVPIDDSKAVKQRTGLAGLARGVGLFASAMDQAPPAHLEDLIVRYSDRGPDAYACCPWFRDLERIELPHYPWTGPLDERFAARGVQALDLRVLAADAPELNESFDAIRNKASVLGLLSATLVLSILDRHPGEDAILVMDRQGGRQDYASYLARVFPFAIVSPAGAPRGEVRYRVRLPDRMLHVRFVTKGDRISLAVGWASMAAKLTRELFMARLNHWFHERAPDVRPTAGYYTDGRRFLDEVGAVLAEEEIPRHLLVRSR